MPVVLPELLESVRGATTVATVAVSSVASVLSATVRSGGEPDVAESAIAVAEGGGHGASQGVIGPFGGTDIAMLLLTISVAIRVINFHFFKIPSSVAMAFGAILMTLFLLILSHIPMLHVDDAIEAFRILLKDFPDLLLNYMLGFLLFAAAIEVDLRNLGRIFTTVLALSVVSTLLSTLMVGILTYLLMQNIAHMDFAWCLLFGAIVSPTDPVTVISILNDKPDLLPSSTKYFVIGESLLNDAIGVVLYLTLSEIIEKPDIGAVEVATLIFENVVVECLYGAIIGVFLAWLAYSAIGSVKDPLLEVVITFVLVGNINMVCRIVHASIPLASVCAGLFIGNYAVSFAMHDETVETFHEMWKLADETLNSILFLMVGAADLFWNPQDLGWGPVLLLVVCTISISIVVRFLSVALPLLSIIFLEWVTGKRLRHESVRYRGGTIGLLTWAGMRGGISIALALGVPDSFVKHAVPGHMTYGQLIFFMTFILVVFSIVVQGMLFEPVIRMINRISYEIMPSGGLGTYVSTMSLGNGLDFDDQTFSDSLGSGEAHIWGTNPDAVYVDYDPGEQAPPSAVGDVVRTEDYTFRDDFQRTTSDIGIQRTVSMHEGYHRRPAPIPAHVQAEQHARQGSITFQNLPTLEAPPSIPAFFGDLRRRSTYSLRRWFDLQGRIHNDKEPEQRSAIRRSQTEPDTARLARGEASANVRRANAAQNPTTILDMDSTSDLAEDAKAP
ncbi:unnamed protein product [Chondrus crispus]|uniref:Cation/H+ exchanger transmembrane domain-containing protein n=1 Tax=Chondrus crispus TaxID=2769 RepID=R7QIY9_CHOCR|nr:unnamed protein product [Chondrus crispus]CDF38029.1 unnamed protein product [Chondrus crispus]|eukprot:XP_005717898.1 unnamed protein product [Chondrus crispus]